MLNLTSQCILVLKPINRTMKKILFAAAILIALQPVNLFAQAGKVYDNLSVPSKILKSERKFAIYLPPDYETSGRTYPVLYLLHGSGDDQTGWCSLARCWA